MKLLLTTFTFLLIFEQTVTRPALQTLKNSKLNTAEVKKADRLSMQGGPLKQDLSKDNLKQDLSKDNLKQDLSKDNLKQDLTKGNLKQDLSKGNPKDTVDVQQKDKLLQKTEHDNLSVRKDSSLKLKTNLEDTQLKFIEKAVNSDEKLSLNQLKPVDHVDAVKMEQDGHLNKEYHKELFLGNHEAIEENTEENAIKKLQDIFAKVDADSDGLLSEAEMESWIVKKMEEHFAESIKENDEIFEHLNPDPNGTIPWKVYYTHFLLAKGYPLDKAKKQVIDYDQIELSQEDKDELIHYKFRWTDVDVDPVDNALSKSEFLVFRHPEQSEKAMNSMVYNILNTLDKNGDQNLTEEEFVALPPGEVEGHDFQEMDKQWQADREREFRESIDRNGDGIATVQELKNYIDPRNPVQALMEARNLISLIDDDQDGELSKDEIMKHKNIFLNSKVVNLIRNFHDEF